MKKVSIHHDLVPGDQGQTVLKKKIGHKRKKPSALFLIEEMGV
jgi:hypothetical protein